MNLCNPKICNCEQGRKIKYTNIDDINTLINEFTSNNPNVTCRQVQMNMDIYDIYYDYIDDELSSFHFGEKDWEKPLEYFFNGYKDVDNDFDLHDNIFCHFEDSEEMIKIYHTYIPTGYHGYDKYELFTGQLKNSIIEAVHDSYYKMLDDMSFESIRYVIELFNNRIKNKTL